MFQMIHCRRTLATHAVSVKLERSASVKKIQVRTYMLMQCYILYDCMCHICTVLLGVGLTAIQYSVASINCNSFTLYVYVRTYVYIWVWRS